MKPELNQIKKITKGIVRITEEKDGFHFYRFTEKQEKMYKEFSEKNGASFYMKTFSTAGVKLLFKTNSRTLKLKGHVVAASSRCYYSIDVFVDSKYFDSVKNFDEKTFNGNYATEKLVFDKFSKSFIMSEGDKTVCIYLPWSMCTVIEELSVDDGSFIESVAIDKKMLSFGDSITQGYDALHPSVRYSCVLAEKLGAEEVNKGIGGEVFRPELAGIKEDFIPDYVTVAYGTNDWVSCNKENFTSNCSKFFEKLNENYPSSKIFAITPIWRKYYYSDEYFCNFSEIGEYIKSVAGKFDNITAIDGFDLIPHNEIYYGDLYLHPNDKGFEHYAQNLYEKIKEYL